MPKTDLHVHLDGSVRINSLLEMARKQHITLPSTDEKVLKSILVPGIKCRSLEEYLTPFEIILPVLQEAEALSRVAFELAEDAARENVWYMEVRYSPVLHMRRGMELTAIIDAVLSGLQQAERKYNIKTGVIVCGMRNISPATSIILADLAVTYKNRGVVGFDLAGIEENYPAKDHREAFYRILNNNINCTAHAGEAYGPGSIHQALHYCGAHRIGHGTRLKENIDLLNYVNDHRIPLEICLTSNIQTKAVPSLDQHPLKFYYDFGLRVTINTDNRLVSNTSVTRELMLAARCAQLNMADLKTIIVAGFKSAFLPMREKSIMLNLLNRELDKY